MLEINVFLSSGTLPAAFTLNPESGHVLFSYRTPLAQADLETLANSLQLCVEQAESWRVGYFFDSPVDNWNLSGEPGSRITV
ncbi:CesT family type III secretion system chaperone [Paraburkholderia tuberum]|uniref:CesT family type III secretion system chaperone n=1 Tax=Paraburkholderia tuberum TaxID=157910 RepID=UPI000B881205|nr:CesT family type III secretion system chaperone [Paraburkholderia tuberum]